MRDCSVGLQGEENEMDQISQNIPSWGSGFSDLVSYRGQVLVSIVWLQRRYISSLPGCTDRVDVTLHIHKHILSTELPLIINSVLRHAQSNPT